MTIEYSTRTKYTKNYRRNNKDTITPDEYLQNLPIMFRGDELYICPSDVNWEDRHYKVLFGAKFTESQIQNVCTNYLEGLEWVFTYYSSGCNHWKWKYNYHYPPLFKDLCKYVPHFDAKFICTNNGQSSKPFLPSVQLAYVLPPQSFDNMSSDIRKFIITNYKNLYTESVTFCWAFCRYFWEAHPILPDISLELLEQWDVQFRMHFNRVSTLKQ